MSYIYDLTDTWNAAGTTFNAIKMNVTNTASAAGSRLITCQISGVEKFSVNKDGVGYFSGNVGIGTSSPGAGVHSYISGSANLLKMERAENSGVYARWSRPNKSYILALDINNNGGTDFSIYDETAAATRVTVDGSGNVGIGTSSPGSKLSVVGRIDATNTQSFLFNGTTGTYGSFQYNGTIVGDIGTANQVVTSGANTDFAITTRSTTALVFGTNTTERLRIDSSGNVGIGTSSPGTRLHLQDTETTVRLTATSGRIWDLVSGGNGNVGANFFAIRDTSSGANVVQIAPQASEAMRIDSSGNVGIGTSSPGFKLDIASGDIRLSNTYGIRWGSSDQAFIFGDDGASGGFLRFGVNSEWMRITDSGNVGIGTSSPGNKLDIVGTGSSQIRVKDGVGASSYYDFGRDGSDGFFGFSGAQTTFSGYKWSVNAGTEVMRITNGGNVGIGVTPSAKLDVAGTSRYTFNVANSYTLLTSLNAAGSAFVDAYTNGLSHIWQTSGSERMRLTSTGVLGLGVSGGDASLHIAGIRGGNGRMTQMSTGGTSQDNLNLIASSNGGGSDQWFSYGVSSSNYYYVQQGVGAGSSGLVVNSNNRVIVGTATAFDATVGANFMAFGSAGSAAAFKVDAAASTQVSFYDNTQSARVGWIGTNGSSTSYNTTSDRRLKQDIQPVGDVGDKIDAIRIISHKWRNGTDATIPYGVIAQDLYEVAPHAVTKGDDGEEVGIEWGVDYSKLVPMLVKEIQSLRARMAQLEG